MAATQITDRPLRVALLWNGALQAEHLLSQPAEVVIGEGKDALFQLPEGSIDEPQVTLLAPEGGGYRLQPQARMGGHVWLSGRPTQARGLREPLAINRGDYGLVTFGSATVFFQYVRAAQGLPPRRSFRDGALAACVGLSLFVHVAALLFVFLIAAEEFAGPAAGELDGELARKFLIVPPPEELTQLLSQKGKQTEDRGLRDRDEAGGKKAKDDEGRIGKRDATREKTELQGAPADSVAAQVRGMGLLGVLSGGGQRAMANALDTPSLDSLLGGLGSAQSVTGRGSGGLSLRGGGTGGGGKDGVAFGAGELGTAVGGGKGLGRGEGGPGKGGRGPREAQLSLGGAGSKISGFLSAEQINRVVQANKAAIKYCFETALQQKPNLDGAINVQWRIDRKGFVSTTRVAKSTLNDSKVEGCILRQVKRWKFPEPDGGEVDVVYPFVFRKQ